MKTRVLLIIGLCWLLTGCGNGNTRSHDASSEDAFDVELLEEGYGEEPGGFDVEEIPRDGRPDRPYRPEMEE